MGFSMKKPVKKTYTIDYWDCGDDEHRHTKYSAAEKCIARRAKPRRYKPWTTALRMEALKLRREGKTYPEIAAIIERSPASARNAVQIAEWIIERRKRISDQPIEVGGPDSTVSIETDAGKERWTISTAAKWIAPAYESRVNGFMVFIETDDGTRSKFCESEDEVFNFFGWGDPQWRLFRGAGLKYCGQEIDREWWNKNKDRFKS